MTNHPPLSGHPASALCSGDIIRFHDQCLALANWPKQPPPPPNAHPAWQWIVENHRQNSLLWAEEDLARRTHVEDREIAANKRAIDAFNQARNDAAERVDEEILISISPPADITKARQHSETIGMMVDRMSIMSLKIVAMRAQTERLDASAEHRSNCKLKLDRLIEQRGDLGACIDRLLAECVAGIAFFKIYRQFKMYNDPTLNPHLYQQA